MDLLKKITDDLEPLGGELYIDRFVQAQRPVKGEPAPVPRAAQPASSKAAPKAAAPAQTVRVPTRRPRPEVEPDSAGGAEPNGVTDTGKLRAEVEAFLNRDEAEGTSDSEVQEFLKERQGFDPSELE
jgi:hypothetical protein